MRLDRRTLLAAAAVLPFAGMARAGAPLQFLLSPLLLSPRIVS